MQYNFYIFSRVASTFWKLTVQFPITKRQIRKWKTSFFSSFFCHEKFTSFEYIRITAVRRLYSVYAIADLLLLLNWYRVVLIVFRCDAVYADLELDTLFTCFYWIFFVCFLALSYACLCFVARFVLRTASHWHKCQYRLSILIDSVIYLITVYVYDEWDVEDKTRLLFDLHRCGYYTDLWILISNQISWKYITNIWFIISDYVVITHCVTK